MRLIKGIEGMEEFLLGPCLFPSCPELNIVYQQKFCAPEFIPEIVYLAPLKHSYKLIHKAFRGVVAYLCGIGSLKDPVPDGLKKVCFSKTDPAVYKKRIVSVGKLVGNSKTGCMCQLVILSHNKIFKGTLRVETCVG